LGVVFRHLGGEDHFVSLNMAGVFTGKSHIRDVTWWEKISKSFRSSWDPSSGTTSSLHGLVMN
jgi:hypothetical protein